MSLTLGELARRFDVELKGDRDHVVVRVASLENAGADALAFLANPKFRKHLAQTAAGAVVLAADAAAGYTGNCLIAANPYACFARIAQLLHPRPQPTSGRHASAVIAAAAQVADSAWVGAHAVIEEGAVIGERAHVGAGCWVGRGTQIADDSYLYPNVIVYHGCRIGRRCVVHAGAVIGADGFGYANDGGEWVAIPQLGGVVIGDDVGIGANTTIDRGAMDDTRIENGVKLDNLIQIAHNVQVGEHTAMAAFVGVAGSTRIGRRCTFGGRASVAGHLEIVDDVHVTATTFVTHSLHTPGVYSSGAPLQDNRSWRKNAARMRHLDEMAQRVKRLEQKISASSDGSDT